MFSYYGSKSKIVKRYPPPEYDRVIEPFAGSARYCLEYAERDCLLIEIDPVIYGIWRWLIKEATEADIASLPDLKRWDDLRNFQHLSKVERDLLGFAVGFGRSCPGNVVTPRADATGWEPEDDRWRPNNACDLLKTALRQNLSRIRHWTVLNASFNNYKTNAPATWFVDPPYQNPAGRGYVFNEIDYQKLAGWCKSRRGQVIVAEGAGADWLPFQTLPTNHRGSWRTLEEKIWTNRSLNS